jgi:hypothetical protein
MGNKTRFSFNGEVTVDDDSEYMQDYIQYPFTVPTGISSIIIYLEYEPLFVRDITNLITLGLFDPSGFRGNAHRIPSKQGVILSANEATVGFIPGSIPAGEWLAQLSIHAVVADTKPCKYRLDIELVEGNTSIVQKKPWDGSQKTLPSVPGWYRGELHSHTTHSDGDCTVQELINNAVKTHLDFLAITDHNTTSTLYELNQTNFHDLLIIPGFELTTFHGHALALGIDRWVDWRTGYDGWTINDAALEVQKLGGVFILAHPNDIGSPRCTGCKWEYPDINFDLVDAVEIWNSGWWEGEDGNTKNLLQWQNLQKDSRRMPFTAGTDYHQIGDWDKKSALTYVYATELSVPAILEGIRKGRVIISNGPRITLQGIQGEEKIFVEIGDTLHTSSPSVRLLINWNEVPDNSELLVHTKQGVKCNFAVSGSGSQNIEINVLDNDSTWIEIYGQDSSLLAITNPIYIVCK